MNGSLVIRWADSGEPLNCIKGRKNKGSAFCWTSHSCLLLDITQLPSVGHRTAAFCWTSHSCLLLDITQLPSVGHYTAAFCWTSHSCLLLDIAQLPSVGHHTVAFCWTSHSRLLLDITQLPSVGHHTAALCWTSHSCISFCAELFMKHVTQPFKAQVVTVCTTYCHIKKLCTFLTLCVRTYARALACFV